MMFGFKGESISFDAWRNPSASVARGGSTEGRDSGWSLVPTMKYKVIFINQKQA